MSDKNIYKKLNGTNLSTIPDSFWTNIPDSFWTNIPDSFWTNIPYSFWTNMPDSFWTNIPDSFWTNMPYSVWTNIPDLFWTNMPYSFWTNMPYSVWENLPKLKLIKGLKPLEKPYSLLKETLDKSDNFLEMDTWHTCETTHCVAGWIEVLHPKGKELAQYFSTPFAASAILKRSRPDAPLPNFYGSNDAVMEFINDRAKEEEEGREFELWT